MIMNKAEELMRKYHYGFKHSNDLLEDEYVKDLNKEIERLNNIINTTSTLLKHERYNYHDKPVAKGIQVDDVLSAAIFTCDLAINVLENKYINEWDKEYLENALKEGK